MPLPDSYPALPAPYSSGSQTGDLTMELLELELSLDGFSPEDTTFADHVRDAATVVDGILLFDLPASGLIADCDRIAVVRMPQAHFQTAATVFACLETDGATIRIERPDDRTAGLQNFAEAFVDVLRRIG